MRSIKPGRGPSFMGGVGSAAVALFGVFWTLMAAQMGAPFFFLLFGLVFVGLGIAQAVYHFKNATSPNRMSAFDVTGPGEEPDPLNLRFGSPQQPAARPDAGPAAWSEQGAGERPAGDGGPPAEPRRRYPGQYCPFCGGQVQGEFDYCLHCGKDI